MREKEVEMYFVKKVKALGGMAIKLVSPSFNGMPDRIMLLPFGRIAFVELKALGKKPRPLQINMMLRLQALGFECFVADTKDKVDEVIGEMLREI